MLTVGHDANCGKKYTSLALLKYMEREHPDMDVTFRSTGQTGFLISNSGINMDTVDADHMAAAAEWLTPSADSNHWDIIEGQGSVLHPLYAGGSVALLMGSQPDYIVMCVDVTRTHYRGTKVELACLCSDILLCLRFASRSNPDCRLGAISLNVEDSEWDMYRADFEARWPLISIVNPNIPQTFEPVAQLMRSLEC